MKRTYRVLSALFACCFLLAVLIILRQSGLALALLLAGAGVCCFQRKAIPHFTLWLLLLAFLLRVFWVFTLNPPIISDFNTMYQAAESLVQGDASFSQSNYFIVWAYQTPFVLWEAALLRLCNHVVFLKLVNALLSAGSVCLVYRLIRPHVRPAAARVSGLLLAAFPFSATLPTVLTNQIAAGFFMVLAVWCLICPDAARLGFWRFPLTGLLLQVGNLLRPEGIILLVAIAAWLVFTVIHEPKEWKGAVLGTAVLLAVYFAVGFGAEWLIVGTGLNPEGIQNNFSAWKFVCGFNFETGGMYSAEDWSALAATFDDAYHPTEETDALVQSMLSERLNIGLGNLAVLMVRKIDQLWNSSGLGWAFGHLDLDAHFWIKQIYTVLLNFDRSLFQLAALLSGLGLWKKGGRKPDGYLIYFVVFASFCAFLPIEVQPRYAYLPQLFLFGAAAFGVDRLLELAEGFPLRREPQVK